MTRETNWGWSSDKDTYFKISEGTCIFLHDGESYETNHEYNDKRRLPVKYFTLPKEFVCNDST